VFDLWKFKRPVNIPAVISGSVGKL
jgi:hypothetical protein